MSFRQAIQLQPAVGAFSTTSTTLATLTIAAPSARHAVHVCGFSIVYATAPGTATAPVISTTAGLLYQIGTAVLTNTAAVFPTPIQAAAGASVKLQVTLTAAGVINLSLLYFIANP